MLSFVRQSSSQLEKYGIPKSSSISYFWGKFQRIRKENHMNHLYLVFSFYFLCDRICGMAWIIPIRCTCTSLFSIYFLGIYFYQSGVKLKRLVGSFRWTWINFDVSSMFFIPLWVNSTKKHMLMTCLQVVEKVQKSNEFAHTSVQNVTHVMHNVLIVTHNSFFA